MKSRFKIFIKSFCFLVLLSILPAKAQVLQDTVTIELVRSGIDYIYNLQFNEARDVITNINKSYPEHPVVLLLRGTMAYWKNYPLLHTDSLHVSFENGMRNCIKISEANDNPDYEIEFLLTNLCARGMLLMFYADNDLAMEVIPLATSTYKYLRLSFDYNKSCIDLNYFTGLYNYYREAYPRVHPVYKSLAFLFPSGDEESGLRELQLSAGSSVFLRAESFYLLAWLNLYYENKYPESLFYCKTLHELYPENMQYLALYIHNLLLMKQYDEAEVLISDSYDVKKKSYSQAQLTIFKGILQEKKYRNNNLASELYIKGINDIKIFGDYSDKYASYAYYGLSRIFEARNDKQTSRTYRKMAVKLSDYKNINFE